MDKKHLTVEDLWEMPEDERYSPSVLSEVTSEDLLKILDEYVLDNDDKEKLVNELKRRDPSFVYVENDVDLHEEGLKYPALNGLVIIYTILGWVLLIGGLIGAIKLSDNTIAMVLTIVASVILAIFSFASAESIKVMTDISSFSYQILKHLKSKD
jgi:hypothetical protein